MFSIRMLILMLIPSFCLAQQAIEIETQRIVQDGFSTPSITFKPTVSGMIDVNFSCGNRNFSVETSIEPGKHEVLEFKDLAIGSHECSGRITLQAEDGSQGEMSLNVPVTVLSPLALTVANNKLDLPNRRLTVRSSRPIQKAKLETFGLSEQPLSSVEVGTGGTSEAELQWVGASEELITIRITAWDKDNFAGQVVLSPWSYSIPHEDVVFETAKSIIRPSEEPKLAAAYADLESVLRKYGEVVVVKLYVGGYTDTVGDPQSNQNLSERRALAIASWFRQAGFGGDIFYQGFGEAGLAVPTEDNVDEARNRRAIYLLAADTPFNSDDIPTSNWRIAN